MLIFEVKEKDLSKGWTKGLLAFDHAFLISIRIPKFQLPANLHFLIIRY